MTNIVIPLGAIKCKNDQSNGLAMTTSILWFLCDWNCCCPSAAARVLLPECCCLSIAAGIWVIVILNKPEVKAVFR
ncbi:MAG: hypothetical protein H8E27_14470 [Verrucomicrobia subdivision 3 bacterium]|nr:hypothetical protein [Limisphaerales bacterium]